MTSPYKTEIEYRSGVIDTLDRCHFFLNWEEEGGRKRSQAFFANPKDYGHELPTDAQLYKASKD